MSDMIAERIVRAVLDKAPMGNFVQEITGFDAAYDIQEAVVAQLAPRFGGVGGYKIAWNAPAAFTPAVGHVFSAHIRQSGAHIPAEEMAQLVVEPEILAVMGEDVSEGGQTAQSMAPRIARYHAGFEIMDRRNTADPALSHPPGVVANNVFNCGLVSGDSLAELPETMETVLSLDGEVLFRGQDAAPQAPAEAVAFIANHLAARGRGLKAGDVILCGTHYPPFAVQAGATLEVSMGALGRAAFSFG